MVWKAGQSGNPAGRQAGTSKVAALRASIAEHVDAIIAKQVELAKNGDATAARLLLERVLPPIKATEQAAPIDLPEGSIADQARAVMAATGSGQLAPGQAAQMLTALGTLAKIIETDELERRIAALEARNKQ